MSEQEEWTPLSLARHFHNLYERAAPEFGYETRRETRVFDAGSCNGKLMIAVCSEILGDFGGVLAAERQATSNAFAKGYDQGYADATAAEGEKVGE